MTGRIQKEIKDNLKAIRKADRELELEINGGRWKAVSIAHKNKKKYDRKSIKEREIWKIIDIK